MKKLVLIMLILPLIFLSCKKEETVQQLVPENYSNWTITADNLNYTVPAHGNSLRRVFINSVGEGVTTEKKDDRSFYSYPEDTIIIKEIYSTKEPEEGEKPKSLSVMIKDSDNPKSIGKWIWIVKELDTNSEKIIDYKACFDCHTNANEAHPYGDGNPENDFRDYVFYGY